MTYWISQKSAYHRPRATECRTCARSLSSATAFHSTMYRCYNSGAVCTKQHVRATLRPRQVSAGTNHYHFERKFRMSLGK